MTVLQYMAESHFVIQFCDLPTLLQSANNEFTKKLSTWKYCMPCHSVNVQSQIERLL